MIPVQQSWYLRDEFPTVEASEAYSTVMLRQVEVRYSYGIVVMLCAVCDTAVVLQNSWNQIERTATIYCYVQYTSLVVSADMYVPVYEGLKSLDDTITLNNNGTTIRQSVRNTSSTIWSTLYPIAAGKVAEQVTTDIQYRIGMCKRNVLDSWLTNNSNLEFGLQSDMQIVLPLPILGLTRVTSYGTNK